jgi:hypothetical protein
VNAEQKSWEANPSRPGPVPCWNGFGEDRWQRIYHRSLGRLCERSEKYTEGPKIRDGHFKNGLSKLVVVIPLLVEKRLPHSFFSPNK